MFTLSSLSSCNRRCFTVQSSFAELSRLPATKLPLATKPHKLPAPSYPATAKSKAHKDAQKARAKAKKAEAEANRREQAAQAKAKATAAAANPGPDPAANGGGDGGGDGGYINTKPHAHKLCYLYLWGLGVRRQARVPAVAKMGYSACSTPLINWRASQPCSLRLNWASMLSFAYFPADSLPP